MSYIENKCPNCGAPFIKGDSYCRTCEAPLQYTPTSEEATMYGIAKSDWHLFVDKNSSRYVEVFSKNEDKKIFFNMNWAAMFFNIYWMFYRKMYKYAFIYLIITTVFSIGLTALVTATIKPELLEARKIIEPYNQYIDNTNELYGAYSDGTVDMREVLNAASEYDRETNLIMGKFAFWLIVPSITFNVIFALPADCIYRRYILRNIEYKQGGASFWSLAGGVVLYALINNAVISPIITYIVTKILQ